jgi:hypothetical protein
MLNLLRIPGLLWPKESTQVNKHGMHCNFQNPLGRVNRAPVELQSKLRTNEFNERNYFLLPTCPLSVWFLA